MSVRVFLIKMHINNYTFIYIYTQKVELAYHSRCLVQKTSDPNNNKKPETLNMQMYASFKPYSTAPPNKPAQHHFESH